jgi:protein required for attachment to host cells
VTDIWILVADGARARLFALGKGAPRMVEIADFVNPEARMPGHELDQAPPPRVHDRIGEGRHAIEARTSPKQKAASQFAAMLGSYLEHALAERRCGDLVLVAPPRFLGALNAALGARLGRTVRLRIPKNLTRSTADEIREALPQALSRRRAATHG